MARILVALGSNVGEVDAHVRAGWQDVVDALQLETPALSPLVHSAPAEGVTGGEFANAVGAGVTHLTATEVLHALQVIERRHGRDRGREGVGRARTLDLDLLDWDGVVIDSPALDLPHPRLADRDFVLVPLLAVAPDFVDARSGRDVPTMLGALHTHWNLPSASTDATEIAP